MKIMFCSQSSISKNPSCHLYTKPFHLFLSTKMLQSVVTVQRCVTVACSALVSRHKKTEDSL